MSNTSLSVGALMTRQLHVIDSESSAAEALALMQQHGIRHLPVMHNGAPYSVVSEHEINLVLAHEKGARTPEQIRVAEMCAIEVFSVEADTPLQHVLERMTQERLGSALITDNGKLAGIFTYVDACRVLLDLLRQSAISD